RAEGIRPTGDDGVWLVGHSFVRRYRAHGLQFDRRRNFREDRGRFDRRFQERLRFPGRVRETVRAGKSHCIEASAEFACAEVLMIGAPSRLALFSAIMFSMANLNAGPANDSAVITFPPSSAKK